MLLRRLGRFLLNGRFCLGVGVPDLLQDGVVILRRSLGQTFKERVRDIQYTAENLQPNAGAEFVREVYALGKQGRPPDGAGADMVLPSDALAGLFGGPVVFKMICSL